MFACTFEPAYSYVNWRHVHECVLAPVLFCDPLLLIGCCFYCRVCCECIVCVRVCVCVLVVVQVIDCVCVCVCLSCVYMFLFAMRGRCSDLFVCMCVV